MSEVSGKVDKMLRGGGGGGCSGAGSPQEEESEECKSLYPLETGINCASCG